MIDKNDTRWVQLWRTWRGTSKKSETYQRLSYIGSDRENALLNYAKKWSTEQGPGSNDFGYGFKIVDKPPKEWIAEEIKSLKSKLITIVGTIEDLTKLAR